MSDRPRAAAAIRETLEETNVPVRIARLLYERDYRAGREYVYLAELVGDIEPSVGCDPELPPEREQWIREVRWHPLESMRDDCQVSLVIRALGINKT